jgi:hypothetical protein
MLWRSERFCAQDPYSHIDAQISSKKVVEFTLRKTLTLEAIMASMDLHSIGNVFKEIHINNLKLTILSRLKANTQVWQMAMY